MPGDGAVRVACLYRVSTLRQVEENDIPLQKNACRAFISRMDGWVLTHEYIEKGVSGYHKSAVERDVLQQARRDAERGLYDVLLVFMFDRLGRREDETPFVVEWFVRQGVAVWSVKEGRQTFDNRVDKLLNYIRFWQSGGESEKTSIRVKEKHRQMVLDGQFRGGGAPYGYALIDAGRVNNKGIPLKKLIIDDAESEVVRTIFRLAAEQGYGGRRIAGYLNERKIPTKRGNGWTPASVTDLLKNPIYAGRYVSGRRMSKRGGTKRMPPEEWIYAREPLPELAIVSETIWDKVAALRAARVRGGGLVPMQTRGTLLLIGIAKCGGCGRVLRSRSAGKPAYRCPGGEGCNGQKTFTQHKVDPVALSALTPFFKRLPVVDITGALTARRAAANAASTSAVQRLTAQAVRAESNLALLKDEIAASLHGGSVFSTAQLAEAIENKETELHRLRVRLQEHEREHGGTECDNDTVVSDWKAVFHYAPVSAQKMLLASLLREVRVSRGAVSVYASFSWCVEAAHDVPSAMRMQNQQILTAHS